MIKSPPEAIKSFEDMPNIPNAIRHNKAPIRYATTNATKPLKKAHRTAYRNVLNIKLKK